MPELYGRAAGSGGCLLITSTNESQPMTLLEAMACECPVVAPDIGGIGEVVLDAVTGLLYPAGQTEAAVAAVRKVLTSPAMRERIVRQARDLVTLDHSPARTAEFYMSITKKTRSAPRAVPNVAALATEAPQPMPSVVDSAPAGSVPPAERSDAQDVAARLDALVGEFVSLHMALLRERDGRGERALATLLSRPVLDPSETAVKAYSDIAPGAQIGFEPSGSATLAVEPRRDFSHSPAHCLNTFTLRYSGKSRWFTLELALDWEELRNVDRYQIGLYVRADREARPRCLEVPSHCRRRGRSSPRRFPPGAGGKKLPLQRPARLARSVGSGRQAASETDLLLRPRVEPRTEVRLSHRVLRVAAVRVALGIVTIERPHAVARLVRSARRLWPDIPIHVADQSANIDAMRDFYSAQRVNVVRMPFDAGLAASRNALVDAADEEFLFLCDDDFVLGAETRIEQAIAVLETTPPISRLSAVACTIWMSAASVCVIGKCTSYDARHRTFTAIPIYNYAPIVRTVAGVTIFMCDAVLNFCVLRRSIFCERVRWDDVIKINGEHEDFYLNLELNRDWKVGYVPSLAALHCPAMAAGRSHFFTRKAGRSGALSEQVEHRAACGDRYRRTPGERNDSAVVCGQE